MTIYAQSFGLCLLDQLANSLRLGPGFLSVIGSSLYVFSAFRFINQAREERKPIGVINIGPTRADKLIDLL